MPITDWPAAERPREKLLARGAQALSDAELLALFVGSGVRGHTAVDLARQLVQRYGGLRPLLEADQKTACAEPGLGPARYALLQAALEIARRHLAEALWRGDVLENPAATARYLSACLRSYAHEVFGLLLLDSRHRVIRFEELAHGTLDQATVHAREVVKCALAHNAAAVILTHNHPSGVAEPSIADRTLTERLKTALALVDIRVLDHVVIGDGTHVSFAERGWL